MAQGSDSNDTCYTGSPSPDIQQDYMDNVKKIMRREKNRIAAQKSRIRQTQKADSLHLESEKLERENTALRREVKQLTEEAKYLSAVLSHHEPLCCAVDLHSSNNQCSPPFRAFQQAHVTSLRYHL